MASDNDDLKQALQENLRLERELGAEAENARMKQKPHYRWRHLILEVIVYAAVILAFAYAARQLQGVSLGKIEYETPSWLRPVR
jgi:hypothetical protein